MSYLHRLRKKFHYVAGSSVLPPTAEQDIELLRKAMLSLFTNNLDNSTLIKNIKLVCSLSEFEDIQTKLKEIAQHSQAPQLGYGIILNQLWREKADEIHLNIKTASPQKILIRAGHIFRPKFQYWVKNLAARFHCNDQNSHSKKASAKKPDGFKIRRNDKDPFRMRQKEEDPSRSCYNRPERHTDILAGMIFPETDDMMERIENYFSPVNNSNTIGFKPKYRRPDDTGFGGIHLKTTIHMDIGDFKDVPFIVELQAHKKDTSKAYNQTHELMQKQRAFEAWAQSGAETTSTIGQSHVIAKFGQRLVGYGLQRSKINEEASGSLAKYQQNHDYHIIDSMPVISVTSGQGSEYDHCLIPTYRQDRDSTFLTIDNAYGEKTSHNTRVNREQCIARLHAIAYENSDTRRLQYIPKREPISRTL